MVYIVVSMRTAFLLFALTLPAQDFGKLTIEKVAGEIGRAHV